MPILVITGQTACGKSAIAAIVAEKLGGALISADSRQVFRRLDIGTAKPHEPTALVGIVEPEERYSAARFVKDCLNCVDIARSNGKIPIIVGGTGLYIRALTVGIFEGDFSDPQLREQLRFRKQNGEDLFATLSSLDPETASAIDGKNPMRVERALEVLLLSGKPLVYWWSERTKPPTDHKFIKICLTLPKERLIERIVHRIDSMLAAGWIDEVRNLLAAGLTKKCAGFSSLGYPQIISYIDGEIAYDAMREKIVTATRQYAKRQATYFRKEPNLLSIDISNFAEKEAAKLICEIMESYNDQTS
jgi:tRNA dimethylallyltransferase